MGDPNYGGVLYHLAATAARKNDPQLLREVGALADELDRVAAALPADHPHHSGQLLLRGVLAMASGDLVAAEAMLRDCADRRAALWGRDQKLTAYARNVLGECVMRQGRLDEAEPMLMETADLIGRAYGTHHAWTLEAAERLAQCRTARNQP
jgi:tetratricopeptide (TPR) repeat protein